MYNFIIFTDVTDNMTSILTTGPVKIASTVRKAGYSCLVVNLLSEYTLEELKEIIDLAVGEQTLLVGVSSTFLKSTLIERDPNKPTPPFPDIAKNTMFPQGLDFENSLLEYIRSINPNVRTVQGGAKVGPNAQNKNLDFVCIGYSENSIVNLLNHLSKGEALQKSHRNIWGITVIDDRKADGYDFASDSMVLTALDVVNFKVAPIEIARGCIFSCKFCSLIVKGKDRLDFVKYEELIYQEIKRNYELFGITHYQIIDETFNDHEEKLLAFKSAVDRLDFQPIFWCYTRLDLLCTRPHTLQIMYDIGVRSMFFGIETLDEKSGRAISKGFNRQKQVEKIAYIKEHYPEITMHGSFILGLPQDSIENFYNTFNQLVSGAIKLDSWNFKPLELTKFNELSANSELSAAPEKYGYTILPTVTNNTGMDWKNDYTDRQQVTKLALEFNHFSNTQSHMKPVGQWVMGMHSYAVYDDLFRFENLKKVLHQDLPWNYIERTIRPKFIADYKKQFLEMLTQQKADVTQW